MQNQQLDHQQVQSQQLRQGFHLQLLANDIEVPLNIGSLFRIADALGLEKIWLCGKSAVPPNPKIRRTSRACEQYVPFAYQQDALEVVAQCKRAGYQIICLEISACSVPVAELRLPAEAKICLVLGAENEGVAQALLDVADQTIHIPMLGVNSSMNVANACAIASYEITRQLQAYPRNS